MVEVDGIHHPQPGHEEADERRTQGLRAAGYEVIRFSTEEVLGDLQKQPARRPALQS